MQILQETGVAFYSESARKIFKKHGAKVDGDVVRISAAMLESALESSPPNFKWWARDRLHSAFIGYEQERTHVSPNNGPIYIQDLDNGRRLGTREDLANLYKLCQATEVCDIVGAVPVNPSDIPPERKHLDIMFELLRHTDKPLIGFAGTRSEIEAGFDMVEIAMGAKGHLMKWPTIGVSVNPLSPLRYDELACQTLMTYARHRQPVFVLSCAQVGVTAPATLLGTIVLQNAEMLAGLALTQLIQPGTPFLYSPASAVINMANASYVTGSPESNLINIVGLQLAQELYELPCRSMAGLTDAKDVDCQAGLETMQNLFLLMLAGVHLINECLGVLDSIMTTSYEKFIIDTEMLERILRIQKGISFSEDHLALDAIRETGHDGSYLMHPTTVEYCRQYWQPTVSYWGSYDEWDQDPTRDIVVRANRKYKAMLEASPETLLGKDTERDLRRYMDGVSSG